MKVIKLKKVKGEKVIVHEVAARGQRFHDIIMLKIGANCAIVCLTGDDENRSKNEHLIRQKEGFVLRGFTLRKSKNWEKIST